jgi:hypothetical protein
MNLVVTNVTIISSLEWKKAFNSVLFVGPDVLSVKAEIAAANDIAGTVQWHRAAGDRETCYYGLSEFVNNTQRASPPSATNGLAGSVG